MSQPLINHNYIIIFLVSLISFQLSCSSETPTNPVNEPTVPVVKIVSPNNNSSVLDSVIIKIQATDDKGITKVELYIDNVIKKSFTVPPYEYTLYTNNFTDGSKHSIYAKAFDSDGNTTGSEVVIINVYHLRPSNLRASIISDSEIMIKWSDNSSIENKFEVEQKINNGDFALVNTVTANTISTNIEDIYLSANTYTFRVRAISDTLISNYSNSDSIKIIIPKPFDFKIGHVSSSQVKLEWKDTCSYNIGISIERNIMGGDFYQIATIDSSHSSYLDNSIDSNLTYSYRLRSYTQHNKSEYSKTISIEYLFAEMKELKTLTGHAFDVHSVSYDKQGEFIISGSGDNTIKVWDANTYSLLRTLNGHTGQVFSVDINPANQIIVSSSQDKTIKLWNLNNGNIITTLVEHTDWVRNVAFNPSGNTLASGSSDGRIIFWSTNDWSKFYEVSSSSAGLVFNPSGSTFAYATSEGIVFRDANNGSLLKTIPFSFGANDLAYSPDGNILASATCNSVYVWNVNTGQEIASFSGNNNCVRSVCFLDNKTLVFGVTVDLKICDVSKKIILGQAYKVVTGFNSISKSPISNKISTGNGNYSINIWELSKKWIPF